MFSNIIIFIIFLSLADSVHAQVVINEFSSQSSPDWIELYNTATESADLSLYYVEDSTSKLAPNPPLEGMLEPGKWFSFSVLTRLNADGDIIKLFKEGSNLPIDQISYGDQGGLCAPSSDQSIGSKPDGSGTIVRFVASTRDGPNVTDEAPCATPIQSGPTRTSSPTKMPLTATPQPTLTHTPAPMDTPIPTLPRTPTPKKTLTPTPRPTSESSELQVLGESIDTNLTPIPQEATSAGRVSYKPLIITMLLVSIGLALIAGVLVWQKRNALKKEGDQ